MLKNVLKFALQISKKNCLKIDGRMVRFEEIKDRKRFVRPP